MPGYFDGSDGVQRTVKTVKTRMVAINEDFLSAAPLVTSQVPVLLIPRAWPFNFGESFNNELWPWARYLSTHPEAAKRLAIIAAMPHNMKLPSFWQLLSPLLSDSPGIAPVSSFEEASECEFDSEVQPQQRCGQPLCFERLIGCSGGSDHLLGPDMSGAWEDALSRMVAHFCPAEKEVSKTTPHRLKGGSRDTLRIVFALRDNDMYRKLLNREQILERCNKAVVGGKKLECTSLVFSDAIKDICALQSLDVLVSMTGAQVANANFMRRGASVVEIRPHLWYDADAATGQPVNMGSWFNFYHRQLWMHNSTFYWWVGITEENTSIQKPLKLARDADVKLPWAGLECVLSAISSVGESREAYERRAAVGNIASDCGRARPAVDGGSD